MKISNGLMALVMLSLLVASFVMFPVFRSYYVVHEQPVIMRFVFFDHFLGKYVGFGPIVNLGRIGSVHLSYLPPVRGAIYEFDIVKGLFVGNLVLYFVLVGLIWYYYRRA